MGGSLYDRLGGKAAITAVIDDFVARCAADARINGKFARTDIARLKANLVDQVCEATGGPCQYAGRDMHTTHLGMSVTGGEFDALVEDLVATLDGFSVPEAEKNELLGALAPMRRRHRRSRVERHGHSPARRLPERAPAGRRRRLAPSAQTSGSGTRVAAAIPCATGADAPAGSREPLATALLGARLVLSIALRQN